MNTKFASDNLRAELARRSIVYGELADELGVHPNTIGNWVNGRAAPSAFMLLQLLQHIGYNDDMLRQQSLMEWYAADELQPA